MKIKIADIKAWWAAHQADRDAAVTFIHKYPMQVVVLLVILLILSLMHSCSQAVHHCDKCVSAEMSPATSDSTAQTAPQSPLGFVTSAAVLHTVYAIGRPDGGTAYFVPMENAGITQLVDTSFVGRVSTIGYVYNDPSTMGTIVEIGNMRIGVKPYGRYQ